MRYSLKIVPCYNLQPVTRPVNGFLSINKSASFVSYCDGATALEVSDFEPIVGNKFTGVHWPEAKGQTGRSRTPTRLR